MEVWAGLHSISSNFTSMPTETDGIASSRIWSDFWLSTGSGVMIVTASRQSRGSLSAVGSGIGSVHFLGGGWLGSGSEVGLVISSSVWKMVDTDPFFTFSRAPTPQTRQIPLEDSSRPFLMSPLCGPQVSDLPAPGRVNRLLVSPLFFGTLILSWSSILLWARPQCIIQGTRSGTWN